MRHITRASRFTRLLVAISVAGFLFVPLQATGQTITQRIAREQQFVAACHALQANSDAHKPKTWQWYFSQKKNAVVSVVGVRALLKKAIAAKELTLAAANARIAGFNKDTLGAMTNCQNNLLAVSNQLAIDLQQTANMVDCNSPRGSWKWFNNFVVTFDKNYTMTDDHGGKGTWSESSNRQFVLTWTTYATTDSVTLNDDGLILSGTYNGLVAKSTRTSCPKP